CIWSGHHGSRVGHVDAVLTAVLASIRKYDQSGALRTNRQCSHANSAATVSTAALSAAASELSISTTTTAAATDAAAAAVSGSSSHARPGSSGRMAIATAGGLSDSIR